MSKRKPRVGEWVRVDYDDVGPRIGIYLGEGRFIEPYEDEISDSRGAPVTQIGQRFEATDMKKCRVADVRTVSAESRR
jgi:hypothetical protein